MYKTKADLDETTIVFFTQKFFFLPFHLGKEKLVFFIIIFLWERITKKFQCRSILWHGATFYQKTKKLPWLVLEILQT